MTAVMHCDGTFRMDPSCFLMCTYKPSIITRATVMSACISELILVMGSSDESQSYIKILNLLFSNPMAQIQIPSLRVSPKSQSQDSKSQSNPVFLQVHKHELRSVQQRSELAICQCHCQCYLIACFKFV